MGSLPARKKRISLVVEFLEDRQLLSQFGPASGWDPSAQEVAARPELRPAPVWGSMVAANDPANRPMTSSGATEGPASSPLVPGRDGFPMTTGPASNCVSPWPTVVPSAFGEGPGSGRATAESSGPAGNFPIGSGPSGSTSVVIVVRADANGGGPAPGFEDHGPARGLPSNTVNAQSDGNLPPPRLSPGPSAGPNASIAPTSRQEPSTPVGPGGAGHSDVEATPLPSTVSLAAAPNAATNVLPRGPAAIELISGQGPAVGPPRVALPDGGARGFSGARPSADAPPASGWYAEGAEVGSGVSAIRISQSEEVFDVPGPQAADMITSLLPFGRASLEAAVDQFLDPFDSLASSIPGLRGPMGLVAASLAVAVTVLTVDVALRLRRSRGEEVEVDGEEALVAFPGLPGARRWSRP